MATIFSVEYLDGAKETEEKITRAGEAFVRYKNKDWFRGTYVVNSKGLLVREGKGVYHWSSGAEYSGGYKDGLKHGEGTYTYPDGSSYEGEWKAGKKEGKGKFTHSNGDIFIGTWKDDMKDGNGTYVYYAAGSSLIGKWERGELIEGKWKHDSAGHRRSFAQRKAELDEAESAIAKGEREMKRRPIGIIIAGAPASGKGTQCENIRSEHGVIHLSTGDMLRAAVAAGTEVGKEAQKYMNAGQLVPDEIVIAAVKERLEQDDVKENGFLLDGFPRTRAQAEALEDMGIQVDIFLLLDVPDEVVVERISGRRIDPATGNSYHVKFNPPPEDVEVVQRDDDTEEKVMVRLEGYHSNIEAIRSFYGDRVIEIDGAQERHEVWQSVNEALLAVIQSEDE